MSIDELTGAYPRGPGLLELEHDRARVQRSETTLVLAFVDVDKLETVNDTHGHEFGDRVLRDVANSLRASLRPFDLIVRVGGDDFICAVIGLSRDDAERLFESVNAALTRQSSSPSVTTGISQMVMRRHRTAAHLSS